MAAERAKVALVTGAAGIIGPGICEELKADGWLVVAADYAEENFSSYQEIHGHALRADLCLAADLARPSERTRLIEETRRRLGPIRLLINNATAKSKAMPFAEITAEYAERFLQVELLAPLQLSQEATLDLAEGGQIINISSVLIHNIRPGNLLYASAKAGFEKMTESLAVELASKNIRVNCLRIGAVPGDAFLREALRMVPTDVARALREDILPRHYQAVGASSTLSGEAGRPSDIGKMIVYLASPAGRYINAAVLPVDGAFSLAQQQRAAEREQAQSVAASWAEDPVRSLDSWRKRALRE